MTGGVTTLKSCKHFSDARIPLLCLQIERFRDSSRTSLWNFATWCFFMLCRFPLSRFIMHSQRNRINSFGQDWRKRLLHLWENDWNTWRVEKFFVFIVQKFWLFQPVRDKKNSREWIRCLYTNVIDRLCVATNQSTNDQRKQTLQLDTSQLVLNQDLTVWLG